ncbi:MAG: T9SS type A sorting domain-containing protein, partial [Bacteroidetes bacterium]|nr:T9SS type A sorting domain-containing protein [Bacteroidota bacterium]
NVFNSIKQIYTGPIIHLDPCAVADSIEPNKIKTQNLILTNTGSSELNFSLEIDDQPSWISTSASGYQVQAASEAVIQITFNSSGLSLGTYSCILRIQSNLLPEKLVPVTLVVDTHVGYVETRLGTAIQFYPNPFTNSIKAELSQQNDTRLRLEIFSQLGTVLFQKDINPQNPQLLEWNASGQPSGMYYYRLISGTKEIDHGKIIKQ